MLEPLNELNPDSECLKLSGTKQPHKFVFNIPCRPRPTYRTRLPIQDGSEYNDYAHGIELDDDGSVVVAGATRGEWAIPNLGEWDFAAFKLDADGNLLWTWQVTNSGSRMPTQRL